MSDHNTGWAPNDIPPAQQTAMPPAQSIVKQAPGFAQVATKAAQSPNFQALQQPVNSGTMAGISSFNQTMEQSLPFRIAKGLVNIFSPKAAQNFENATQQANQVYAPVVASHPGAALAGKIGGVAGQALAGANVPTSTIGQAALAAGITGLPYAGEAAANAYEQTGSVGQAAKAAALNSALGVAGGTALGAAGLLFGKLAKAAHPILNEVDAASYGIVGRDISKPGQEFAKRMGVNPTGYKANTGDEQLDKVMQLLREQGGRGKVGLQKATGWVNDQYGQINQLYRSAGGQVADKLQEIMASPIVQTLKSKFDPADVDQTINLLVSEADRRIASGEMGWTDAVKFLNKQMERGISIGKKAEGASPEQVTKLANMGEVLQDSASVVKAHLKEQTTNILGAIKQSSGGKVDVPDLEAVDHIYSAFPSLQMSLARRAGKPIASAAGGSESTAGLGTLAAMSGVAGPGAAAVLKIASSTALAPLVKRAMGAATNQVMGRSAAGLDKLLQSAAQGSGGIADKSQFLAKLMQAGEAANIGGASSVPAQAGVLFPEPGQTPAAGAPPGAIPIPNAGVPSGAQPIPNAPATPPTQSAASTEPLSPAEQSQSSFSNPEGTKTPAFSDKAIEARLQEKYSRYVRQYGQSISFDQYKQAAYNATQGFDPMQPSTWKAMFDDPATSDKLYKGYLGLQKMTGVNVEDVLNHYSRLVRFGPRLSGPDQKREDESNVRVVGALADMTGRPVKEIDTRLRDLALDRSKTPDQRKQALMEMIIKEGGVDVPLLSNMGLLGG